jgi:hypothetical protein
MGICTRVSGGVFGAGCGSGRGGGECLGLVLEIRGGDESGRGREIDQREEDFGDLEWPRSTPLLLPPLPIDNGEGRRGVGGGDLKAHKTIISDGGAWRVVSDGRK